MSKKEGLLVFTYRSHRGDFVMSDTVDQYILTGEGVEGPFEPSEKTPELVLLVDYPCGNQKRMRAVPRNMYETGLDPMFGGNFVYTTDSRFPSDAPIKIFDRVE